LLFLVLAPALASAQGLLVVVDPEQIVRLPRPIIIYPPYPIPIPIHPRPRPVPPPAQYKIAELRVDARLADQVAQVQVSQTFENTGSRVLEASFVFPLPHDGAIEEMTLMVDGKEYPAKLLDAKEARRLYEEIVRKNQDPALLEWMGTGLFKTSVFPVPPGAKRTVSLRYSQLCRKQQGLTDFLFPLSTAKYTSEPVGEVTIRVTIGSAEEIKNVYSPTHEVKIKRPDDRHATITYNAAKTVPSSDFRLFFDTGTGPLSAKVVSYRPEKDEDGYFLLLASPKIKAKGDKQVEKTVMFVVDRSGSMSGKKMEQARGAARFVLNNLREGDLFNIVAYDSRIEAFRPELERFNDETRKAALGFIEGIHAGGATNIDGALSTALAQLQDLKRPNYVLFLTDGLPTTGETNEMKIVENATKGNKVRARIFSFGVGYDVNSRLLEKLSRENFGQTDYVRPDEDIEASVSRLYNRIESPVMTDVQLAFEFDEAKTEAGPPVSRIYPPGSFDLFAGEQLVVVGRYRKSGAARVVVKGSVAGKTQKVEFPAEFTEHSKDETHAFIEKLWAIRRVGEILDELDLKGKNDELIEELVKLSTRHGILTPYTSFMADENTDLRDVAGNVRRADGRLEALSQVAGREGVSQRAMRGNLQRARVAEADAGFAPAAEAADAFGAMPAPGGPPAQFGFRGPGRGGATGGAAPMADVAKSAEELKGAGQSVRQIANRTFYRRGEQWVDSRVTEAQEKNARRVKQFSDEYFALARDHGRTIAQYLVFDEPVLLNLGDEAYLIEP
jgi:Ca-activated chloride channel family protein